MINISNLKTSENLLFLTYLIFIETLQNLLKSANSTFKAALPQWNEINTLFPKLKEGIQKLRTESFTGKIYSLSIFEKGVSKIILDSRQIDLVLDVEIVHENLS